MLQLQLQLQLQLSVLQLDMAETTGLLHWSRALRWIHQDNQDNQSDPYTCRHLEKYEAEYRLKRLLPAISIDRRLSPSCQ